MHIRHGPSTRARTQLRNVKAVSAIQRKRVNSNLPKHALFYVRSVTDDPNCAGLLFAGTGNGLYYSLDDGEHWTALAGSAVWPGAAERKPRAGGRGAAALDCSQRHFKKEESKKPYDEKE